MELLIIYYTKQMTHPRVKDASFDREREIGSAVHLLLRASHVNPEWN